MIDKNFLELAKIVSGSVCVLIGFWKLCDAFFAFMAKRQKNYLNDLVDEATSDDFKNIWDEIKLIRESMRNDTKFLTEQLREVISKLNR